MTYAAAQSLATTLRATTVADEDVQEAVADLHLSLCDFSPRVEVPRADRGTFFVDPSGLVSLYGSLEQWSRDIVNRLAECGWSAVVVVGFHRFRCHALAKSRPTQTTWVLPDPHAELRASDKAPLCRLEISAGLRDALAVLGIETLGQFVRLPGPELRARLGNEAWELHRAATTTWSPLSPKHLTEPVREELELDEPDADHSRLLFGIKGLLHRALAKLAARGQALQALHLQLHLDHAPTHDEVIEPAAPTLDVLILLDLVRLRLEGAKLAAAVTEIAIRLDGVPAHHDQLALFHPEMRDLRAAARALARVRAAFGPSAVTRARLRAAHLPEAGFAWESTQELEVPRPCPPHGDEPSLVRRLFRAPIPLPAGRAPILHAPRVGLHGHEAIVRMHGPYRISGGWWVRLVERDYYYAETLHGSIAWIFYDRPRRRWFLHGLVD